MCSNSSLKSLSQLKTKFTWDHHRIGEKIYSNDSGQLLFFILILSAPRGSGAFSGDFTTNLARQCRAFSRALKIEKLKAPLFRGPEGLQMTGALHVLPTVLPTVLLLRHNTLNKNNTALRKKRPCNKQRFFTAIKMTLFRGISLTFFILLLKTYEPRHEKTGFLHMRKQRRRSASRYPRS